MFILLLAGVALVAAVAVLVARAVSLPRLRAIARVDQIAAYGYAHEPGMAGEVRRASGTLESLAHRVGLLFGNHVSAVAALQRELVSAGMYEVSPITIIGYRVICAVGLPALFLWTASSNGLTGGTVVFGTVVMLALGWMGPVTIIRRRARNRLTEIDYALPELVDLLVVTVESGLGFAGSMQVAAERFSGPLGDELRLALQEQAMGLSSDESLVNLLGRADTDGMRSFVRSVRQGESLGVSIGQIMRNLADEMRQRRRAAAEAQAQKAPIKILFPLVALIFPAILMVLLVPAILSFTSTMGGG